MSQIGTLLEGAGVQTIINLQYCPQIVNINPPYLSTPLDNFSVSVAGKETININGNSIINSFANWLMESSESNFNVGFALKVANGNLPNQQTQLRFTNTGAGTPAIYAYSDSIGTDVVTASTNSVNADANQLVADFDFLAIDPTNFDYAQVSFQNGFNDRFDINDIESYFAQTNQNDQGRLFGNLCFNNIAGDIASVTLYATNGGNCTYLVANI